MSTYIDFLNLSMNASIVQWLEFVPSKHEVRVRFPVDAVLIFNSINIIKSDAWACSVTVITEDSESSNPGSNPGRPIVCFSSEPREEHTAHIQKQSDLAQR